MSLERRSVTHFKQERQILDQNMTAPSDFIEIDACFVKKLANRTTIGYAFCLAFIQFL